jgi:hypothetical protein
MRSGQLSARAPWVPHIDVPGCSVWPTPRALMHRVKCHAFRSHETGGPNLEEVVARRAGRDGGYLNPLWIEWLMGFPVGWCEDHYTASATP